MKQLLISFIITIFLISVSKAQDMAMDQSFLFDEEDQVVRAQDYTDENSEENKVAEISADEMNDAVNQAKNLLNTKPAKLPKIKLPNMSFSKPASSGHTLSAENLKIAPFGLLWGADQASTLNQGIKLQKTDMKDYVNSFLATSLPKPLDFFNRVYAVFGKDDKLYRILSYSEFIEDDSSATKGMDAYNKYSALLEKKYGNKQVFFTPAVVEKTIKNSQGKDEITKENAPLGNPDFLNQLASGSAVLYSTYNNQDVAAALSIGVDGDKKSYIVIDYKNLSILKEQEQETLDAL